MTKLPIAKPPVNLRQRRRADGSVRIWWEPRADARTLGFETVELDERRLTWSVREAERLNRELAAARKAGRRAAPSPGGRSIAALTEKYRVSAKFRRLAAKTRDSYAKQFALICEKWGAYPAADFTKPAMHEWYEALLAKSGPATASARLRHMSILMAYAELIGWRPEGSNPCSRLGMQTPKGRRRVVTWAEFDALVAAAQDLGMTSVATAIILGMLQGQRQTDILAATCGAFSIRQVQLSGWPTPRPVWVWQLVRSKRGNEGAMILHDEAAPHVAAAIEAARARLRAKSPGRALRPEDLAAEPLLVDEAHGLPFVGRAAEHRFQNRWAVVRSHAIETARAAGGQRMADALAEITFRDLRRSFGVHSRAGGASKDDTADVLGNSAATDQLLGDIYMAPSFETASRAVLALQRAPAPDERKKA
ncbi:hypothetical protein [Paenirhodobacter sp. CAU 1674]|uniref:hypothetical protein n=1 Tax=Paenirhodobacter sp. CAU 1674 TaxID=3032596 RepID=UPI0023D98B7F|nr:hypothetical protein [Paenirhodobacter sp. CAU 1674]MDF2143236.1 hypothetical protein [Paenirhodobacter sp. CAU 1674]